MIRFLVFLTVLLGSLKAWADCAARPDFTTSMRIARVEPLAAGDGCWLRGEWTQADGKASFAAVFTRDKALCGMKPPATKLLKGRYGCCDAGGMPPPCSWGTSTPLGEWPSGITVVPAK